MKKILLFLFCLTLTTTVFAQTFTFNMRHNDNGTNYTVSIDVSQKRITAKRSNSTEFSCSFYSHNINNNVIGLALTNSYSVPMTPNGSSYFLLTQGGAIIVKLTNGNEYPLITNNSSDFSSKYNQLAQALNSPSTPTNNNSSSSNRTFNVNGVSFTMVYVQGGTFTMGATSEQGSDAYSDEKPTHSVTLSSYMIGQTEVTQALWQAVMGNNPSRFTGDSRRPVEMVSWDDCQEFLRKLNSLTGQRFRLPTEAEWEFAARGGNKSNHYKYSGSKNIGDVAWYYHNSSSTTHPVGKLQPNELGIYDMSGNVYEWCSDWYGGNYYSSSPSNNPQGPSSGSFRVLRGGSWFDDTRYCRVSFRFYDYPVNRYFSIGLRLAF